MDTFNRREFARWGGAAAALIATGWNCALAAGTPPDPLSPLAPELRGPARQMLELHIPPITAETLASARLRAATYQLPVLPEVAIAERRIPAVGTLPGVTVFVINSDPTRRRPAILHLHGGGFILGAAKHELRPLQELAMALDCVIVTVDYRLAPETTWVGSTEDAYAGLSWLYAHAAQLGVDRSRIAVMGESAGGGHAALLAIKARDRAEIPLVLQVLVYPMLDDRTGITEAVPPHIATVGWSISENHFGWHSFLGREPGRRDVPADAVPARCQNLAGLAPAWIGVGGVDLFAAEDIAYARHLSLANVPTELLVLPGAFHGFDRVAPESTLARRFAKAKLNALRRAFGNPLDI